MPAVTLSAGYGLGGSVIARAVAERLGWPLLDRAISSQVAQQLQVTSQEAEDGSLKRGFVERFFGVLAPMAGGGVVDAGGEFASVLPTMEAAPFREKAEAIVRDALPGGVVVLGRAGAAMLAGDPDVLRVRLFGPAAARIAHAVAAEGVDEQTARQRLPQVDKARAHYVRKLYDRDIDDPALYHLQIDSTLVPTDAVVTAILAVHSALPQPRRRPRPA